MEWYSGSGIDDLVVPKDQDFSDGISSSPEIWTKWGPYAAESPNKCFDMDMNMIDEDFNFNGFCIQVEKETSVQDKEISSGSSVCGGSLEESTQRTSISCCQPDYELDHFAEIEQLDDIYLYSVTSGIKILDLRSSLLEDLPRCEDLHKLFAVLPANNLLTDKMLQSNYSNKHGIISSKYLQTHAFSPSVDWGEGDVAASTFIPCNSEQKDFLQQQVMMVKPQVPSGENIANETVGEEISVEESVLQELQMVMAQLTDRTRISFRDALYRLAENSRQDVTKLRTNDDFTAETPAGRGHDVQMRCGKKKAMESETNVIDRTIANLMFNKMDMNVQDFPVASAIYPKQEVGNSTQLPNDRSNQLQIRHFCQPMVAGDAEVPMFDQKHHHQVATQRYQAFSKLQATNRV